MAEKDDFHTLTQQFQRQLLLERLTEHNWNVSQTARALNLSRSHVHNLMRQFKLERVR